MNLFSGDWNEWKLVLLAPRSLSGRFVALAIVVVLFVFVIMLIGSQNFDTRANYRSWVPWAGLALGLLLVAGLAYAILQAPLVPGTVPANEGGVPEVLGMYLYTQNMLLVELAAVLLLVALLGALLLARRPKAGEVSIVNSE